MARPVKHSHSLPRKVRVLTRYSIHRLQIQVSQNQDPYQSHLTDSLQSVQCLHWTAECHVSSAINKVLFCRMYFAYTLFLQILPSI